MQIEDGQGKATLAGVTAENRLRTASVSTFLEDYLGLEGQGYHVLLQSTTLTSANESVVLYIRNDNNDAIMFIAAASIGLGKASAAGNTLIRFYANPTGGTIISAPTAVLTPTNRNLAVRVPAVGTFYSGTEAKTQTGGTIISERLSQDMQYRDFAPSLFLPVGSSMCVSIVPPATNTSMAVTALIKIGFLLEEEI